MSEGLRPKRAPSNPRAKPGVIFNIVIYLLKLTNVELQNSEFDSICSYLKKYFLDIKNGISDPIHHLISNSKFCNLTLVSICR